MRPLIYGLFIAIAIVSIHLQQRHITRERQSERVSTFAEWSTHGKPVSVQVVAPMEEQTFARLSLVAKDKTNFVAYVSKSTLLKMTPNLPVEVLYAGKKVIGTIQTVAQERDRSTGLYPIEVFFQEPIDPTRCLAKVPLQSHKKAIYLPPHILEQENGSSYVWMVKENKAHKQVIEVGSSTTSGVEVLSGLQAGDCLIVEGMSFLRENDSVRVAHD